MKPKITNLLLILVVVTMLLNVQPVLADGPSGIDLSKDANGNQISDAVESEFALVSSLPANQQSIEIQRFVSRLNVSQESRSLQLRDQKLTKSLATATPKQAESILKELANISAQLKKDPAIAKAESDIQKLAKASVQNYDVQANLTPGAPIVQGFDWKRGDVLAIRGSSVNIAWAWTMTYSHTGNWYDASRVYESNKDGVRLKPLSNWQKANDFVGIARNNKKSSSTMNNAVNWAYSKYGDGRTPYNYIFINKWTDSALYCSQLTWKINSNAGSDVDSNAWQYQLWAAAVYGSWIINGLIIPAVAPDEVMLSSNLTVLRTGYNR